MIRQNVSEISREQVCSMDRGAWYDCSEYVRIGLFVDDKMV
jgi:hypothetical protein